METSLRWLRSTGIALLCVLGSRSGAQSLSAAQRDTIDSGGQVVIVEELPGKAWPRVTVYQYIAASAEEAAAVFADYERHVTYLPKVRKSHVSRLVDSATVEVDYVLNTPIVSDERYTVRNHATKVVGQRVAGPRDGSTASFRVVWTLVRASSIKSADGEAIFEPYGDGSLMIYRNLIVPGSGLAGFGPIRAQARPQVEATARAIGKRVAEERARERPLLDQQLRALRAMVGSP